MVRVVQAFVFACLLAVPISSIDAAPCQAVGSEEMVEFDFRDVPLRDIARWISCARNLNLMFKTTDIGQRHVTWVSSRKVKGRSLKRRFRAMLRSERLRLRRSGGYFVIETRAPDR